MRISSGAGEGISSTHRRVFMQKNDDWEIIPGLSGANIGSEAPGSFENAAVPWLEILDRSHLITAIGSLP